MANVVVSSTWGSGSTARKLNDGSSDSALAISQDRVGIGTASPGCILDLNVPNSGTPIMLALSNSGGGFADVAEFDYNASSSPNELTLSLKHSRPFVVSGGKLAVSGGASIGADYTGTAEPTNGLIVEGSVGLGTTSPQANLHAVYPYSKTDTTERFVFETSSNDSSGRHGLKISSIGGATQSVRKYLLQTHEADSYNSGILGLQPLGGAVGIGTTSPTSGMNLDVAGNVKAQGLDVSSTGGPSSPTDGMLWFDTDDGNGKLKIYDGGASTWRTVYSMP